MKKLQLLFVILFLLQIVTQNLFAQRSLKTDDVNATSINNSNFRNNQNSRNTDTSFKHRDDKADSINIYYKFWDNNKIYKLDTTIGDFYTFFPLHYTFNHLGNLGTAAKSLLFQQKNQPGFDAGFHQFDAYNFTLQNTKFYNTTKPFTQLNYLLGSSAEQIINVLHTQNKSENLNYSLEYRFINSPGIFKNQNASVNNIRFALQYQSPNKRYHNTTIYISNKNASSENGGTVNYKQLDSLSLNNPFELAVRLGQGGVINRNLFNTSVSTGNIYKQSEILIQQQYDLGQKDSIVTDSTKIRLFYPRLRMQHILSLKNNEFGFSDIYADSANYSNYFGYTINRNASGNFDTISFNDKWNIFKNEFSLITFPDKKNSSQFLKASATIETIKGTFKSTSSDNFHNFFIGGEYRNRSKNKVWDIEANAQLYLTGFNSGDYLAYTTIQKELGKTAGSLQLGFQNVNKSPSFIFNNSSSFRVTNRVSFNKENNTKLWANYFNKKHQLRISGEYNLLSNYLYFDNFFSAQQESSLINILKIGVEKQFALSKKINLYSEFYYQQTALNSPINIPTFFTRHRIAFEGNFYTNLFLSTGLELRYFTNYNPSGYSPFNGQFFYQNSFTLSNRPDVNFYFNFKIKTFKINFRAENLNALFPPSGYKSYNLSTEQYPMQTLWMRFGIFWDFIN